MLRFFRHVLTLSFLTLPVHWLLAQSAADYTWWNPASTTVAVLEGQAWPGAVGAPYDRLPARAQQSVPEPVWELSHQSAGLLLRFVTPAPDIVVRYTVARPIALPHMPATGVSGVDLYALDTDGNWLWSAGKYSFRDTIQYRFTGLKPDPVHPVQGREYRLYLPLYNAVNWLEIGVPAGASLTPLPVRAEKPIVVYGTSIAQGACASRPGMAWTALLGRALDRPLINLGFSGRGRLEKDVVDLIAETDAAVFIVDCLPNVTIRTGLKPEEVSARLRYAVQTLRRKHPATPIILTDHFGYTDSEINPANRAEYQAINAVQQQVLTQLQAEGVAGLYRLAIEKLKQDMNTMVDGTHPTDLGMLRYAEAYTELLREVLHELTSPSALPPPQPQLRGLSALESDTRHQSALKQVTTNPPQLVILGDSTAYGLGNALSQQSGSPALRNLGVPEDRLENVLWRVYHDEVSGYAPQQVMVMVGLGIRSQQADTTILAGFRQLLQAVRQRQPGASVLLVGLPPDSKQAGRILTLNSQLAKLTKSLNLRFFDPKASFTPGKLPDADAYARLAHQLRPYLFSGKNPASTPVRPTSLSRKSR